tara:strand:+ start:191 stop:451 length:261 start_codon:yes stop_codon:yes gene_type:complete
MKNVLYQLGDTAANLEGATPAQTGAIGMNPSAPAVAPAVVAPAPVAAPAPVVAPAPTPVNATSQNFSPLTQNSADYIYGSEESRGL